MLWLHPSVSLGAWLRRSGEEAVADTGTVLGVCETGANVNNGFCFGTVFVFDGVTDSDMVTVTTVLN